MLRKQPGWTYVSCFLLNRDAVPDPGSRREARPNCAEVALRLWSSLQRLNKPSRDDGTQLSRSPSETDMNPVKSTPIVSPASRLSSSNGSEFIRFLASWNKKLKSACLNKGRVSLQSGSCQHTHICYNVSAPTADHESLEVLCNGLE